MTCYRQAQPLTPDRALTLFKMYEDKGWAVKQQMIASVSWLTPFVFGLIAFSVKDLIPQTADTTKAVAGWTAFFLSVFMTILTLISLLHANSDYVRSHKVIDHARDDLLISEDICNIIVDENKTSRFLGWIGMQHIGWQFIVIMCFALVLVAVSLGIALLATFS